MKIYIGPYTNDLIPIRRLTRNYEYWRSEGIFYFDDSKWKWYDKIIFGILDKVEDLVSPINRWSNNRKRKIKVRIDGYDVWNMDHTLALIILPMLEKLKENKDGSPDVENEDVPEHLRSPEHNIMDPETTIWDTDEHWHERWEWVMDEMIWAFSRHADDNDDSQFFKNGYDKEGHAKHEERKANGRRLFAKYYDGLWD